MRTFFLFLVLANLAFFAWASFFSEGDRQSDPAPIARQVAPEKLRVLRDGAQPVKPAPAKPAAEVASPAATAVAKSVCVEWGGFAAADAPRAGEALGTLALGARLSQRQSDENATWWVYFPPRPTRQDAQKKAEEVKRLGVEDYFIVQDEGPFKNAVSLGVFKTEAAANARLEALRAKGVKTAVAGARDAPVKKTWFQVRGGDDALVAKLREIAQGFAGSEVRDCAPAATGT